MSFGGVEVRAKYVNSTTLMVETPGHVSPRFVDVLASNDGVAFTDTKAVGKSAKHLYMESALYLTGQGNSGGASQKLLTTSFDTFLVFNNVHLSLHMVSSNQTPPLFHRAPTHSHGEHYISPSIT